MKLDWLRADIASARRASALLVLLLACSMLANVTLAAFAMHMAGRERVVVVPPSINKTFWVESERVSAEYLEQMAYFLLQLTLNVTPQSIDHQSRVLLQYAAPASYGAAQRAGHRRRARQARRRLHRVQRAGPRRRRAHPACRRARPAHHIHQRPPRVRGLEGLRHRAAVRRRPDLSEGVPGDQSQ